MALFQHNIIYHNAQPEGSSHGGGTSRKVKRVSGTKSNAEQTHHDLKNLQPNQVREIGREWKGQRSRNSPPELQLRWAGAAPPAGSSSGTWRSRRLVKRGTHSSRTQTSTATHPPLGAMTHGPETQTKQQHTPTSARTAGSFHKKRKITDNMISAV